MSGRPELPLPHPTNAAQRLGAEVRRLRVRTGLSGAELAVRAGCSRTAVRDAEWGRTVPGEERVALFDELLDAGGVLLALYEDVVWERRYGSSRGEQAIALAPARADDPADRSEFLEDTTIPDGTLMHPGEHFRKVWTIRNIGTVPWESRRLVRIGQAAGVGLITTPPYVDIPATAPGETVAVGVDCIAHTVEGTSRAHFKMADGDGRLYFPDRYDVGLVVQITVVLR